MEACLRVLLGQGKRGVEKCEKGKVIVKLPFCLVTKRARQDVTKVVVLSKEMPREEGGCTVSSHLNDKYSQQAVYHC